MRWQVRAHKLLKACPCFRRVSGCMLEGLVLQQQQKQQQQQQQQQGKRARSGSHAGATALALLTRVLFLFGCENDHVPVSRRIWEMEDAAFRQQPSVRMTRFVDQGHFIACRNEATRVLRVLGVLLEEVQAALQASSPPSPQMLAEWECRLERVLTTSPDPPGGAVLTPTRAALDLRGWGVAALVSTLASLVLPPMCASMLLGAGVVLVAGQEIVSNGFSGCSGPNGSSDDVSNREDDHEGAEEEYALDQCGEQQQRGLAGLQRDLQHVVALLVGSAPVDPAPSS
ncbi:hypothetical protein FOA52_015387 [Chlamydomonas sp. UWO 241]|nr:hypothetical protein FOA52_015387 [Chlamydomonas sp. UWO 241]